MSTFKDILYKKEDNETWSEWNNRLPTDDDKRDYIGETIYAKIYDENKEKAGKITGMLLEMDVEDLIVLLESDELLDEKIKEAYEILRKGEEEEMYEEDNLSAEKEREGFFYNYKLQKYCDVALWEEYDAEVQADALMETVLDKKYGAWGWGIKEEEAYKKEKVDKEKEEVEKEEVDKEEEEKEEKEEKEEEENRYDEEDKDDYLYPVKMITVAEMIAALSKLPPDAKLVMTESGFYSKSDFAEVMLPKLYTVENDRWDCDLPTGTQVYIIGHSHQSY